MINHPRPMPDLPSGLPSLPLSLHRLNRLTVPFERPSVALENAEQQFSNTKLRIHTDECVDGFLCLAFEFGNFLLHFALEIPIRSFRCNVEKILYVIVR